LSIAHDVTSAGAARPSTPREQPVFRLGYRPELDGVRAIAILLVMAHHLEPERFSGGFLGVDVFFVLSGFLITTLLIEEWEAGGAISLPRFYLRRALRLLPALIVLLCVFTLRSLHAGTRPAFVLAVDAVVLFYVANLVRAFWGYQTLGPLAHTWSLSIEEQFYVWWPISLKALLGRDTSRATIFRVAAAGLAAAAAYRAVLGLMLVNCGAVPGALTALDTRADALLAGCLVGLGSSWGILAPGTRALNIACRFAPVAALSIAAAFLFAVHDTAPILLGGSTAIALAVAVCLAALVNAPPRWALRCLRIAPVAWTGRLSYSLYLWHWPLYQWLGPDVVSFPVPYALPVSASFLAAALSHYLVERPALRLKRRLSAPGR
jgi:peptidoglycan/LPS O-acetylase OafA/YrhL